MKCSSALERPPAPSSPLVITIVCVCVCVFTPQVCVYVPGSKGAPSFVRIFQYPQLAGPDAALATKSFFKADRVNMQWNNKGRGGGGVLSHQRGPC